jgi:hypothetical protein
VCAEDGKAEKNVPTVTGFILHSPWRQEKEIQVIKTSQKASYFEANKMGASEDLPEQHTFNKHISLKKKI